MQPQRIWVPEDLYHVVQACSWHMGRVKDLKDPDGRGRVRVELPSLLGEGQQHWTNWAEPIGLHISSEDNDGDVGTWWLPTHNQIVMVGFRAGDYLAPIYLPGPPWQEELEEFSPMTPLEAKTVSQQDRRKGTRLRIMKTEAGHSLVMDDNGKDEKLALVDWTGAGFYLVAPGKKADDQEKKKEESKKRKNEERREGRYVPIGNAKTPGQLLDGGTHLLGSLDLGGQGMVCMAQDGQGLVALFSTNGFGQIGPSIVLDSANKRIYVTAEDTQIQVLGDEGQIKVTRQIIQEQEKIDVEEGIMQMVSAIGQSFSGITG